MEEARRLFRRGARADPSHLYIWQAWGCLEFRQGAYDAAKELFQQGIWAAPPGIADVSLIFQVGVGGGGAAAAGAGSRVLGRLV